MIIISQSFIKALDEEKGKCPARAKAIYIDKIPSFPSDAMVRGNYFETVLMGSTDTGEIVRMPLNKDDTKSVAQQRVESNAHDVKVKLVKEHEMNFAKPRLHIERVADIGGTKYLLKARTDMVTSFRDPERGYFDAVIMDFKITDSIYANFPKDFAWGEPWMMDHTQALFYSFMFKQVYGEQIPFVYLVMDLSPKREYKFIFVEITEMGYRQVKESIRRTAATIEQYTAAGEWPTVASLDNCKGCPIRKSCPKGRSGSQVQYIKI